MFCYFEIQKCIALIIRVSASYQVAAMLQSLVCFLHAKVHRWKMFRKLTVGRHLYSDLTTLVVKPAPELVSCKKNFAHPWGFLFLFLKLLVFFDRPCTYHHQTFTVVAKNAQIIVRLGKQLASCQTHIVHGVHSFLTSASKPIAIDYNSFYKAIRPPLEAMDV